MDTLIGLETLPSETQERLLRRFHEVWAQEPWTPQERHTHHRHNTWFVPHQAGSGKMFAFASPVRAENFRKAGIRAGFNLGRVTR